MMTSERYPRRDVGDWRLLWHSRCGDCNTVFHGWSEESVKSNLGAHQDGRCAALQDTNRKHGLQPHEYNRTTR